MSDLSRTIEDAKHQLEQMIDLTPLAVLLVDRQGAIVRTNRALIQLVGAQSFGQVIGKRVTDILGAAGDAFLSSALEASHGYVSRDCSVTLPTGKKDLRCGVVGSGAESGVLVVIVEDVTAEKEVAAKLEKKHKTEAVGAVSGALAHHLSQPLTVILARAQLMNLALEQGIVDPAELKESMRDIAELTNQMADTLRRMQEPVDFVTRPYLDDIDILDIQGSTQGSKRKPLTRGVKPLDWIDSLMSALDGHEPGALRHANQTSERAAMIAKTMGKTEGETLRIKRCAFLHDVGKIGVADSILTKPTLLSEQEMNIMKNHTEIGSRLLRGFPLLTDEAEVAYAHHERYDGTGYPRGMSGENIELNARIVAVADTFDVLLTGRAYRDSLPLDRTLEEIEAASGKQFDPEVVRALVTSPL